VPVQNRDRSQMGASERPWERSRSLLEQCAAVHVGVVASPGFIDDFSVTFGPVEIEGARLTRGEGSRASALVSPTARTSHLQAARAEEGMTGIARDAIAVVPCVMAGGASASEGRGRARRHGRRDQPDGSGWRVVSANQQPFAADADTLI